MRPWYIFTPSLTVVIFQYFDHYFMSKRLEITVKSRAILCSNILLAENVGQHAQNPIRQPSQCVMRKDR